jgi:hypothetical protein
MPTKLCLLVCISMFLCFGCFGSGLVDASNTSPETSNDLVLEKLQLIIDALQENAAKPIVHRNFSIGDKVTFFNFDISTREVGEVIAVRNRSTYTVQNPDFENSLHEWHELRPID